jgi:hypothetical protein
LIAYPGIATVLQRAALAAWRFLKRILSAMAPAAETLGTYSETEIALKCYRCGYQDCPRTIDLIREYGDGAGLHNLEGALRKRCRHQDPECGLRIVDLSVPRFYR